MPEIVRHLINLAPVVVALLAIRAVNTRRRYRVRQLVMPLVAVLYAILALLILYRFNSKLELMVSDLGRVVPPLREWYGASWLYIAENTIVLTFFVVVKVVLRPILARLFAGGDGIGASIAARIYDFDEDSGYWFIRSRLGNLRLYYRVFYVASAIMAIALLTIATTYPSWPGFLSVAFPTIAVLVIGEFYFSVDGLTRPELQRDILGDADRSRRVVNYGALRRVLRETFGQRALFDGVNLSSADPTESLAVLEELKRSPDEAKQIAGTYFQSLKSNGQIVDANLVEASAALMGKSSVLINNPFYSDLTQYLAFPAYYHLLQHHKCLIIAGRDSLAQDLVSWMAMGLESVTGLPDLWRVELLTGYGRDDLDVGVLRFADIHNLDLITANDDFLRQVEYVILAEPSRMLATGQLGVGLILHRCDRGTPPVFAAFDRNHDGLVDALSHLLRTSLTEVIASTLPSGASAAMVWQGDGPHMHTSILPAISRYLGMGTEISAVALKYDVSKVVWVGGDRFPVEDMMWIAGQYYGQINSFAGLNLSQEALTSSIVPKANPWSLKQEENCFMVVEDEISNVFESIRLYSTRATSAGFVNLVSEDYLLRDYMIANSEVFAADPKAIPSIVPDYARTERNAVYRMILALLAFEVADYEVARDFDLIGRSIVQEPSPDAGGGESTVLRALREAIETHTGVRDVYIVTSRHPGEVGSGHEESIHEHYRIGAGSGLDEVIASMRSAYFFVEDELEDSHYIGALLYGHVYQAMLPGQFITYGGKYYEVQSIAGADSRNGVVLRRAAEHIRDRRTYRQLRQFSVSEIQSAVNVGARMQIGDVILTNSFASISVASRGYLELPTRSEFGIGRKVLLSGVPDRRYENKAILEITLPGVTPEVRRTLTHILNELFVTVFPHAYPYVVALTADPEREFGDLLSGLVCEESGDSILILEDSPVDLGLIVAVERNWQRLFEMATDYLKWQLTPVPELLEPEDFTPVFPDADAPAVEGKRSFWRGLLDLVRGWVHRTPSGDAQEGAPVGQTGQTTGMSEPLPEPERTEATADRATVEIPEERGHLDEK